MKTIGIIAEFNPFHNGHLNLINKCREQLGADRIVIVCSGDFVQRGAPALLDKFTRARMAVSNGADLVIELPVCYSTGSAEFFARGAVNILNSLGVVDSLCFGSESGDLELLGSIAEILEKEPPKYRDLLKKNLRSGLSYASSRENALLEYFASLNDTRFEEQHIKEAVSNPNNILGVEYIRALIKTDSKIKPVTVKRMGDDYHSESISALSSATSIRKAIFSGAEISGLSFTMPSNVCEYLSDYKGSFLDSNSLSLIMFYKLIQSDKSSLSQYLDVSDDLSNKILNNIDRYTNFTEFTDLLKSKDLAYSRISRALLHILLDIKKKETLDSLDHAGYIRILSFKRESSDLLSAIHKNSSAPVIDRLKDAQTLLDSSSMVLLNQTLNASRIYNKVSGNGIISEYSLMPLIL